MKNAYGILGGPIFTGSEVIVDHAVVVRDERVDGIVPVRELEPGIEKLEVDGRLIVPGFVNAHHHAYSALATGISVAPSTCFLDVLENLWWRLDEHLTIDDVRLSARWTIAQSVRNGVTLIIDHHASYGAIHGSLDVIREEIESAGISGVLCFETSDRHGPAAAAAAIEENISFAETDRAKKLFGLHAAFTLGDETLKSVQEKARPKLGFHIHCAEDALDVAENRDHLIDRLDSFSILRPDTLLIHGVHLREDELRIVAERGSTLVHCPDSNMHNGVGTFDLVRATGLGVAIAAGTDGMYSNMLRAYKSAYEVSRCLRGSPNVGFEETLRMYHVTQSLYRKYFSDGEGTLTVGGRADIAVLDYRPHTPLSMDNVWGHLLYGAAEAPVYATISGGRMLYVDGELKYTDERKLSEECSAAAEGLWSRTS